MEKIIYRGFSVLDKEIVLPCSLLFPFEHFYMLGSKVVVGVEE